MEGAVLPGSDAYNKLTPEERALGPRTNNKNLVKFRPGKGKIIPKFNGQLDIAIRYWKQSEGPTKANTITYTIYTN